MVPVRPLFMGRPGCVRSRTLERIIALSCVILGILWVQAEVALPIDFWQNFANGTIGEAN